MVVPADAPPSPSPSYEELAGLVAVLAGRVDGLEAENTGLRAENAELRRRLGMNSGRSSHQRCGSVPQIVTPEPGTHTGPAAGWQEHSAPPVGQAKHAAAGHREQEIISMLVNDGR